jgi:hypothetical protein
VPGARCRDFFGNLEHLPLLYLSFGGATNLHPYSNNFYHQQIEVPMMPDKLKNSSDWYHGCHVDGQGRRYEDKDGRTRTRTDGQGQGRTEEDKDGGPLSVRDLDKL